MSDAADHIVELERAFVPPSEIPVAIEGWVV
jgi:hypothetical protein